MKKQDLEKIVSLFTDEYKNPFILTPTQQEIVKSILTRKDKRIGVVAPTQYGKSTAIAIATIIRTVIFPEKFTIIAPTTAKTEIIMSEIIQHIFDSELFFSQLKVDGGRLEQLKRERNKEHLTFKRGGEVMCLTADARNQKKLGNALLGFGSGTILIDDSPLIPDNLYLYVKRMVGGKKDNFIFETGNPLNRGHFFKTMTTNKRYKKIWIDYKTALEDGRFTQDFIDEMSEEGNNRFFDIFYGCKFPEEDYIDSEGYQNLFTYEFLKEMFARQIVIDNKFKMFGNDIGGGGDKSVGVLRTNNYGKILFKNNNRNTMVTCGDIKNIIDTEKFNKENVYIDDLNIGNGVSYRLKEQNYQVKGINVGMASEDKNYANKKAEIYFKFADWLKNKNNKIEYDDETMDELLTIRYRRNSSGKLQIEPKENLRIRGINSPNIVDAYALTFSDNFYEEDTSKQPQHTFDKRSGYVDDSEDDENFNINEFLNMRPPKRVEIGTGKVIA
ncbi:MAG: hypothetical protein PHH73_00180 [Candidatus Rickettsiella isopodorum]|nr:hypothetical protein [Candidatus Rickettsiella isopodorum]